MSDVKKVAEEGMKVFAEAVIGAGQQALKLAQEVCGLSDEKAKKMMKDMAKAEVQLVAGLYEKMDALKNAPKDPGEEQTNRMRR